MSSPTKRSMAWLLAELAVVVLGVAIGLGATAWWEGLSAASEVRESLARMGEDLGDDLGDIRRDHADPAAGAEAARLILIGGNLAGMDSLATLVARLFIARVLEPNDAEYQLLNSTGQLGDVRDPELRAKITSVYETYVTIIRINDRQYQESRRLFDLLSAVMRYEDVGSSSSLSRGFELDEAASERLAASEVRAQVARVGFYFELLSARYMSLGSEIEGLRAQIGAAVE